MPTFMEPGRSFSLSMGTSKGYRTQPIGISSAIVPDVSQRVFGGIGIDIIVIYNHSLRQFSLSPPRLAPDPVSHPHVSCSPLLDGTGPG